MTKLTIPGQVISDNHLYLLRTVGKHTIKFMTKKGKDYKAKVIEQIQHLKPTAEPVVMTINFYYGDKRKRDVHGSLKALMDAMEGYIYQDDSQVIKLTITKAYDKNNPRAEVEVDTVGELYGND